MAATVTGRRELDYSYIPSAPDRTTWEVFIASLTFRSLRREIQEAILKTRQAIGCVLTDDGQCNGSALLVGRGLILVPKHCFPYDSGYIFFNSHRSPILAKTLIDGEIDPPEGFKADYKIVQTDRAYDLEPAKLSVDVASGTSLQLRYQIDGLFYATLYESVESGRGYATRSDISSVKTIDGDSGGSRFSFTSQAVHSIHQGEGEALKMNDIYQSLWTLRSASQAAAIIEELKKNIVDLERLGMAFSTVSLQSGQVIPERHGALVAKVVSSEGIYPLIKRVFEDIVGFLDGLLEIKEKTQFYNNMWRELGYRYTLLTYKTDGTRLDCQVPGRTTTNLQFQIRGATVATVVISKLLAKRSDVRETSEVANYVIRKFRDAIHWAYTKQQALVVTIDPL